MATFDGSSSLDKACDEFRGPECGPCTRRRRTRVGDFYCVDCSDYLCVECKDYHGSIAVTGNHFLVSGRSFPATIRDVPESNGGVPNLGITCDCNKGQSVEFYCHSHQDVICNACKTFHHQHCRTSSVQEKCSGYKTAKLKSVLAEITNLSVKYDRLKQTCIGCKKKIDKLKDNCKNDIQVFRKELNVIFDNMERNILSDLDKWKQDANRRVDQDLSTIAAAENVLKVDCKRLEDAIKGFRKETMFVADIQVSKALQTYKRKLRDLERDIEKPTLYFERKELLFDIVLGVDNLGSLIIGGKDRRQVHTQQPKPTHQPKPYIKNYPKILRDKKVNSSDLVNVKIEGDQKKPCITGCTVMPSGHVVILDRNNNQIKLLDDSWTITGRLQLPDPWNVSVLDSSNVIVSSPGNKQLQKVQMLPRIKVVRTIKLDKKCYGVAVSGEEIYTTCHDNPGNGEVRALDLQGNIKRRLGTNPDGPYLFTRPYYITVSATGEKIFVSDWNTDTITCLTSSGTVIYTYIDDDMRWPRGLICDSGDNVLVCGWNSHNVHIISPDSKKYRTFLTLEDGLRHPCSIAYKESEDTLIVGCTYNQLLLFKLK